ncbi:MAG TPA: hypothetical protein DDZ96_05520 [Porphyromonadaceae bacterium]|jgi:hypothetical protein|nr:hypothetical protein [Porphyromonadaceae bacterium]HBX19163.1 hypothetical protein [Porphyromonadaceae bacterium]
MSITRIYQGKDVEMLTTCNIMIDNAIADLPFLSSKRSTWTIEFFTGIKTRISNAFQNYLGIDPKAEVHAATEVVEKLCNDALIDLSEVKTQIGEDYKSNRLRRDEILKALGYATFWKRASKKDQEAIAELLSHFATGLTEELKTEFTATGIATETLDRIVAAAKDETVQQANVKQETLKGDSKDISAEVVTEFNGIYSQTISIGKIATSFHRGDPLMREKFSYSKILKNLNAAPRKDEKEGENKK